MRISGRHHRSTCTNHRKQAIVTSIASGDTLAAEELRLLLKLQASDQLRGRRSSRRLFQAGTLSAG